MSTVLDTPDTVYLLSFPASTQKSSASITYNVDSSMGHNGLEDISTLYG
jgi:hypothetical protein